MSGAVVVSANNWLWISNCLKHAEHMMVGALLVGTIAMGWLWWGNWPKVPLAAVTLISTDVQTAMVPVGGTLEVLAQFKKNRDDCHNGRVIRHVSNAAGTWIKVDDRIVERRVTVDLAPKTLPIKVPMIDLTTGKPVAPGLWSLNTLVLYDCPYHGKLQTLDDTITTPPFEIVAK